MFYGSGRFECHLRGCNQSRLNSGETWISGFHRFTFTRLEQPENVGRYLDLRDDCQGVVRGCGSGAVGPDAMSIGSSPGTSEMSNVTTLAGWHAAASRPPFMADSLKREPKTPYKYLWPKTGRPGTTSNFPEPVIRLDWVPFSGNCLSAAMSTAETRTD